MNIQHLLYLVEISRCGSINKAAQKLYVSQPNVSKAVKKLEKNLGFEIFERSSKGIQFTNKGTELLCYAKQLLEHVETIEEHFTSENKESTLRFSISTQHYAFTVGAFIELLSSVKNDSFSLKIREVKTSKVIEDIYSQKSEIGIIFLSEHTERFMTRLLELKDIEFHELKKISPHVFMSKDHPLAKETSVSIEQLDEYPCIIYEQEQDSLNFAEEFISVSKPKQVVYVQDRATMSNIIVHSKCYNIGTGCLLEGIMDSKLVSIPIIGNHNEIRLGWIKLKNRVFCKEINEYVTLLKKYLEKSYCGTQGTLGDGSPVRFDE